MRWIELSSPTLEAHISNTPNWLTVPLETSSPGPLSTGRDSPVMTAWLTEVSPVRITPSTGIDSPGRTRRRSPTCTSSAGMTSSDGPVIRLAVRGVRCTSLSIPARAFATVRSSRREPSCIMKATSPAAKSSLMITDAIRAIETSTSALMSNAVTSPMTASRMIGIPHKMMATHAISKGNGEIPKILKSRAAPDMTRKTISRFVPPHSSSSSNFCN